MPKIKVTPNMKLATVMAIAVAAVLIISWLVGPASQ
jgi:preprotein translocase subunit Sec61beta